MPQFSVGLFRSRMLFFRFRGLFGCRLVAVSCPVFGFEGEGVGTVVEEIVVQQLGDFHEQHQVDGFAFQHLVDVRAVAMNSISKPSDGTPLLLQLLLYHVSDVKSSVHSRSFVFLLQRYEKFFIPQAFPPPFPSLNLQMSPQLFPPPCLSLYPQTFLASVPPLFPRRVFRLSS